MRALHVYSSHPSTLQTHVLHSKFEWQTIITRSLPFNCQITDLPPHSPQKANRIRIACPRKLTWKREASLTKNKKNKIRGKKMNKIGRETNWKSNICHILQLENQRQHARLQLRLRLPSSSWILLGNQDIHTRVPSYLNQAENKMAAAAAHCYFRFYCIFLNYFFIFIFLWVSVLFMPWKNRRIAKECMPKNINFFTLYISGE